MMIVYPCGLEEGGNRTRLEGVLDQALLGVEHCFARTTEELELLLSTQNQTVQLPRLGNAEPFPESRNTILFAVLLPESGISLELAALLAWLRTHPNALEGYAGGVIVDGCGDCFTKKAGRELILTANMAGCAFPGKPLVEATGTLVNFKTLADVHGVTNEQAYVQSARRLVEKLQEFTLPQTDRPHILALHASSRATSNTLLLWDRIRERIDDRADASEISLRNGEIVDCRGCAYEQCLHFGEKGECFYGGVIVDEVYPAVLQCDTLVLICPNYNDAVSANLMAFFNRLTALFRKHEERFAHKKVYALVVSGYSGGDLVAEQVLDAMCCNKNFALPPHFALLATANAPGSIRKVEGIEKEIAGMAGCLLGDS